MGSGAAVRSFCFAGFCFSGFCFSGGRQLQAAAAAGGVLDGDQGALGALRGGEAEAFGVEGDVGGRDAGEQAADFVKIDGVGLEGAVERCTCNKLCYKSQGRGLGHSGISEEM